MCKAKGKGPEFITDFYGVKDLSEMKRDEMKGAIQRIDDYETEDDIPQ
jgi:hypothetical protein